MISFKVYCENYNKDFVMAPSNMMGMVNNLNGLDTLNNPPYGFWLNKWGHWITTEDHGETARQLINKFETSSGLPKNELRRGIGSYAFLWNNGYIRVVRGQGEGGDPIWYWENESSDDSTYQPTQSQQKFLNAISQKWNRPLVRDDESDSY